MNKTYHRRVFGGKDAQWKGIDFGKGTMHPNAIGMSLNVTYDDNLFKVRDGQLNEESENNMSGEVLCGKSSMNYLAVSVGTDLFAEKLSPSGN